VVSAPWDVVATVPDPELPAVTIADLGILRSVSIVDGRVVVTVTPTYSGCPALAEITADVRRALTDAGYADAEVHTVLAPAWTTDWITEAGRRKLAEYGIAPPGAVSPAPSVSLPLSVRCPQCGSPDTRESSRFSGTPCRALWVCRACREPFEHMKAL
jgi:ring-1,2-phenylacetyl-CoA epoxidase subunit PaaD